MPIEDAPCATVFLPSWGAVGTSAEAAAPTPDKGTQRCPNLGRRDCDFPRFSSLGGRRAFELRRSTLIRPHPSPPAGRERTREQPRRLPRSRGRSGGGERTADKGNDFIFEGLNTRPLQHPHERAARHASRQSLHLQHCQLRLRGMHGQPDLPRERVHMARL